MSFCKEVGNIGTPVQDDTVSVFSETSELSSSRSAITAPTEVSHDFDRQEGTSTSTLTNGIPNTRRSSFYGIDSNLSPIVVYSGLSNIITQAKEWLAEKAIDGGYLPYFVIRKGIQHEFRQRAQEIASATLSKAFARKMAFIEDLRKSEIAIHTDAANQQHYEIPTGLMAAALGPRMKYSCCLFETGTETLAEAEDAMLSSYVDKLNFHDGMSLLDLGCGWGAAVLFFAERFPNSPITGYSNSHSQREHILHQASLRHLTNVQVITGDAASPTADLGTRLYDRLLSCEMFEHLKNYDGIMAQCARALRPGGRFLLHTFCHRDTPYHFAGGWMATHFFTGGTMPSADLMLYFQRADLRVARHWWLGGRHYHRTIECWLANFVGNRGRAWPYLVERYGEENAGVWFNRWQVYYLACAEMFVSGGGDTYGVTHYLFEKPE